jgi:hypothetical protein
MNLGPSVVSSYNFFFFNFFSSQIKPSKQAGYKEAEIEGGIKVWLRGIGDRGRERKQRERMF